MKLLALDTATDWCSVALWNAGELRVREAQAERGHGGHLLAMVEELLCESGLALTALDAIAFGRGPGAFTGLRLAASVTQGLAYAAGIGAIPVSDLRAIAQRALTVPAPSQVLVCHDARMGEVYWAGFETVGGYAGAATPEAVARPEQMIEAARAWLSAGGGAAAGPSGSAGVPAAAGAGSGFAAHPVLAAELAPSLAFIHPGLGPHAREIAALAVHDGMGSAVPPEQALPVYVRNNVAVVPIARRVNIS